MATFITKEDLPQAIKDVLMSSSNLTTPRHVHNGVDSPQIPSQNLTPYPISVGTTINTAPSGNSNQKEGTIQFYRVDEAFLKDWGIDITLGGIWNSFTIVPSGAGANQATPQTLADSTPTTIIFDNTLFDLYPSGEYSSTTGQFSCTTAGQYLITSGVTFDNTGGTSGNVTMNVYLEHNSTPIQIFTKSSYIPAGATDFTIDVSGIYQTQASDLLYIIVEQETGGSLTTLTDSNTWVNFQKIK